MILIHVIVFLAIPFAFLIPRTKPSGFAGRCSTLLDALSDDSSTRFVDVQRFLSELDIPYCVNARLVRGLDYYGHTFEITSDQLGAQATVCGGGRYDCLVEQLGGPATPAIGWALGMERLLLLLEAAIKADPEGGGTSYV